MKVTKIILISVILLIIGFVLLQFINNDEQITYKKTEVFSENAYTKEIQSGIDSLSSLSDTLLAKDYYNKIQGQIDDFHENKKLNKESTSSNNEQKKRLSQKLLSSYIVHLNTYASHVFTQTSWKNSDIGKIRAEIKFIKNSPLIGAENDVENSLKEISNTLKKYDEINAFIVSTHKISGSITNLNDGISIDDLRKKKNQATNYLKNNMEDKFVNYNAPLKDKLKEVPTNILNAQLSFFSRKIDKYGNTYPKYSSQKDYTEYVYKPLSLQLYEARDFSRDELGVNRNLAIDRFERIIEDLKKYNEQAFYYDYSQNR